MERRTFIRNTLAASLAGSATFNAFALAKNNPYRKNIGIQLYTLRKQLSEDVVGTIQAVAKAGYQQVEPYGFPDSDEMIQVSKDHGLAVNSSHFAWEAVTNPEKAGEGAYEKILAAAKADGLTHLVIPYLHAHERTSLDDYKRIAERCNIAAEMAKTAGIQLAYHNHSFEFAKLDGKNTGYGVLMKEFSDNMKFEIDVFWVKLAGVEPVKLMKKLNGRVSQLHLKDLKIGTPMPNFESVDKEAFKELGNGMIPMEPIIEAASGVGVEHCHVEQDHSPHPIKSVQQSIKYLASL